MKIFLVISTILMFVGCGSGDPDNFIADTNDSNKTPVIKDENNDLSNLMPPQFTEED
jgi:hypothetical protein